MRKKRGKRREKGEGRREKGEREKKSTRNNREKERGYTPACNLGTWSTPPTAPPHQRSPTSKKTFEDVCKKVRVNVLRERERERDEKDLLRCVCHPQRQIRFLL